jgi:hypothetical protein
VKSFCYTVALVSIFALASLFIAGEVRVSRIRQHADLGWAAQDSTYLIVVGAFGLVASLTSWVLGVYVWSKAPREGPLHLVALPCLVLLGFFWSPFYLLARGGAVFSDRPRGDVDRVT